MRHAIAALGGLLLAFATLAPSLVGAETVDFESLSPGDIVSQVFGDAGSGPIGVLGTNPDAPGLNAAVVFDSANPSGPGCELFGSRDVDLGTPNVAFGGPGEGNFGSGGPGPFQNDAPLGNILIINEACGLGGASVALADVNDADNADQPIAFDFSALGSVTIVSLSLIDVEAEEAPATVALFDSGGALLANFVLPQTGDNGVARNVALGPTDGVSSMIVTLGGSGAIDELEFEPRDGVCDGTGPGETCAPPGSVPDSPPGNQNVCRDDCTYCGDGIVNHDEECDDPDDPACTDDCKLLFCGDGIVDANLGETCDPPGSIPTSPPGNQNVCRENCTYCGDGIPNNGEACDDPNDPACTDDCRLVECVLDVDKFCTVPVQTILGDACDLGDLFELEFEYIGGDCSNTSTSNDKVECSGVPGGSTVDIVITRDEDKVTATPGTVSLGERFTITKFDNGEQKKLGGDTEFDVGGQSIKAHTSCSQPLVPGDVYGSLLLVRVGTDAGDVALPDPDPPVLAEVCEVVGAEPGSCADGKPKTLVFRYTGDSCSEGINGQTKDDCTGDPNDGEPVSVTVTKDTDKVSASPTSGVNLGDLVTVTTTENRLPSEIQLDVSGPNGTQSLAIHTSCSDTLVVGDQFGSLLLEVFNAEGATPGTTGQVVYTYRIRAVGTGDTVSANLFDDQGLLGPAGTDVTLAPGETVELTAEAMLTESTTNVVTASDNDGICAADTDSVTVNVVEPPAACDDDSKVGAITFVYTGEGCAGSNNSQPDDKAECTGSVGGASPVDVVVTKGNDLVVSPISVAIGGEVTIATTSDKFDSETIVELRSGGLVEENKFHTSCSKPLAEGDQFGSLLVKDLDLVAK